jgi:hypothetical protein
MYGSNEYKPNDYDLWLAKQKHSKEVWESFDSKEKRKAIKVAFQERIFNEMYGKK